VRALRGSGEARTRAANDDHNLEPTCPHGTHPVVAAETEPSSQYPRRKSRLLVSVFATLILSTGIVDRLMGFRAPIIGVGLLDFLLIFAGSLIAPLVLASVALKIFASVRNRVGSATDG